jgi:hypothetical protein
LDYLFHGQTDFLKGKNVKRRCWGGLGKAATTAGRRSKHPNHVNTKLFKNCDFHKYSAHINTFNEKNFFLASVALPTSGLGFRSRLQN